jgi:hypothetical protein
LFLIFRNEILVYHESRIIAMTNHEKNYEKIRLWLSNMPKPCEVEFLGRLWRVDSTGVEQMSGAPAHVNCKSILVWYYTFGGQGEPSFDFVLLSHFSHGIFREQRTPSVSLTVSEFREAARRLGVAFLRKERYGESWLWFVLPKIPVLLTYSEADEEFPALMNIKFGMNATTFLPFETLAVLYGLITDEFAGTGPAASAVRQ